MTKIAKEKRTVEKMIRYFCYKKHREQNLCADCEELLHYAKNRLGKCQFGNEKPACKACSVHCYKADMRLKIREVMRYSGPRMLLVYFWKPKNTRG